MGQRDLYAAHFDNFLPEMELRVDEYYGYVESRLVEPEVTGPQEDMAANPEGESLPALPEEIITTEEVASVPEAEMSAEHEITGEQEEVPVQPQVDGAPETASEAGNAGLLFLPPIYFRMDTPEAFSADQLRQLQTIADTMQKQEDAYLVLTAYQKEVESGKGTAIFKGAQQAEAVAKALLKKGVPNDRIFIRGLLSEAVGDQECSVDFSFYLPEGKAATTPLPVVGLRYANAVPRHPVHQRLLYKVQVGALSGAYGTNSLDAYEGVMVERQMDGPYYRYTVGAFTTFEEAEAFKVKLLRGAFTSAYVAAYIDGRRADQMRARRHIIDFPDLKAYTD